MDVYALQKWADRNGLYGRSDQELLDLYRRADVRIRNARNYMRDVINHGPCTQAMIQQADELVQRRTTFKRRLGRFMLMMGVKPWYLPQKQP